MKDLPVKYFHLVKLIHSFLAFIFNQQLKQQLLQLKAHVLLRQNTYNYILHIKYTFYYSWRQNKIKIKLLRIFNYYRYGFTRRPKQLPSVSKPFFPSQGKPLADSRNDFYCLTKRSSHDLNTYLVNQSFLLQQVQGVNLIAQDILSLLQEQNKIKQLSTHEIAIFVAIVKFTMMMNLGTNFERLQQQIQIIRFNSKGQLGEHLCLTSKGLSLVNQYNLEMTTVSESFCLTDTYQVQAFCIEGEGDTLLYFYYVAPSNSFDGVSCQVKLIKFNI